MFTDVMIDFETFGLKPNCVVASLGFVLFDPWSNRIGDSVELVFDDHQEQLDVGRQYTPSAIDFWLKQKYEARLALTKPPEKYTVFAALALFRKHLASQLPGGIYKPRSMRFWGNGSDFDNVILASLVSDFRFGDFMHYGNNRCYRTMKNMAKHIKMERSGTHHSAADDAVSQAKHLQRIFAELKIPQMT